MSKVHGWRRPVRWARNIVLGIFGVIAVVVLGAYVFFETGYGKEVLRDQIETRMAKTFRGGASIGGLDGNPLSELVLTDVVINDASKQPAISIGRLTIKLPLMPLISNELRVDKIIADELDVRITRDARGELNVANLQNPSEPSTWSIKLPNVEVHRGHVRLELGGEPVDIDNLEVFVDAALPFAGPIDASASVSADWRQKRAPIDLAANLHIDDHEIRIHNAAVQVADIDVAITQLAIGKGPFAVPASGVVALYAPRATVRSLVPSVDLPGDVSLLLTAEAQGRLTELVANASVGDSHVELRANADIQAKLARGVLTADELDLTALTNGSLQGQGGAVVAFEVDANDPDAELPTLTANVDAWARTARAPTTHAQISLSTRGEEAKANIVAHSDSGLRATIDAAVRKQGERMTLERATIVARTPDTRRASQGAIPLRGSLDANLTASGTLAPALDLAVRGHANGRRLRMNDIAASSFALRVDAKHLPRKPVGTARVEIADLRRGDMELGKLTVAAGNRPDGKLQVSVRSQPKRAPWLVDLDALVTLGETIAVDLQRHMVRAAGGSVWRGNRGRLTVSPRQIALRDFLSTSGRDRIAADATFVRAGRGTGNLAAELDAKIDLSSLAKAYTGKVDAKLDIKRTGNRFSGTVDARATGVSMNDKLQGTFDATVKVAAKADELIADVSVGTTKAGQARIALDVDAPKNLADTEAWRRLGRAAIRNAQLSFDQVNLAETAKLAGLEPMAGRIDGEITLTPSSADGVVRIRGAQVPQTRDLGTIEADLRVLDADQGDLRTTLTARLKPTPNAIAAKDVTQDGAARLLADVTVSPPQRLFDPLAWQRLGANAFRGGTLRVERVAFQPGTLERLGIVSDMRGELAVGAELEPGLSAARIALNVHNLRGGLFAEPIAANISAILDAKSSRVVASIVGNNVTLLRVTGHIPVSLDQLRTNPEAAQQAPLAATARMNSVPARALMTVLGTSQITGGTLDGTIEVKGTVARPTVEAEIVARGVTVPSERRKPTQSIDELKLDASWDGTVGKVAIEGTQSRGGMLRVRASANPQELATATASLVAKDLDIAPLVAFMPGPAGALGGELDANFTLKGADLKTAELSGNLHVTNGRIPIAPAIGTLFQGDLKIGVRNRVVDLALAGRLGNGDVKLTANAPLDGATPKNGKLQLTLRKVRLIGTTEPIITGTITADLARVDDVWRAEVLVDGVEVDVPAGGSHKLSPVGAPPDLVYGGLEVHHGKNKGQDVPAGLVRHDGPADFKPPSQVEGPVANRKEPDVPVADIRVKVRNLFVESDEARGLIGGNIRVTLGQNQETGIVGRLSMSRGVLDLFSRRYQVDKAQLSFDGSPDPVLDVRITYDFPEVTTVTEVRGRMSDPELVLSSNPARYTQAELLGFLLGGEPGGDPSDAPSATARVAGAGASFLAGKIAAPIKKALPVDIDVLRYEAASSTNSAAVTVGTWITDTLFLAYRRHLEARPDENTGEAELEYWIRRRLVLEGVAGDRGVNGLDLLWRRRW